MRKQSNPVWQRKKQENTNEPDSVTPSYSIKIDGEEYKFPMSYEEFKAYGWTYYLPEQDDVSLWSSGLASGMSAPKIFYDKGDIKCLEFVFYNPQDESAPFDKCQVIGFIVEYGQTIEGKDAEQFMNIPAGSIEVMLSIVVDTFSTRILYLCGFL